MKLAGQDEVFFHVSMDSDITQCRKQHLGLTEGINALSLSHTHSCAEY